ncbi:MAG TPA: hypothetical protein PK509_06505 [Catalimonadaceae bacterium]|nr:hypothetical protein [Catalimonadaceae bacterium]
MATKELIDQLNQLPEDKLEAVEKLVKELLGETTAEKKGGVILGLAKGDFKILDGWNDPIPGFEPFLK